MGQGEDQVEVGHGQSLPHAGSEGEKRGQSSSDPFIRKLGERRGDEGLLEQAVAASREVLKEWTRERVPLNWAVAQNNLGGALCRLREWRGDEGLMEQSVAVLREALKEQARERVPIDWAMTQNNLASALATLGRRRGG